MMNWMMISMTRAGETSPSHVFDFDWILPRSGRPDANEIRSAGGGAFAVLPVAVLPGKYELRNFGFGGQRPGAGGTPIGGVTNWISKEPLSWCFEVVPGRITYLGRMTLVKSWGTNMLGMRAMAGGRFVPGSASEEDVPFVKKLRPELAPLPTVAAVRVTC